MSCTSRFISRAVLVSTSRHISTLPIAIAIAGPSRIRTTAQPRFIRRATNVASPSSSPLNPGLPPIPPQPAISVRPPSLSAIKEEGFFEDDVQLVPPDEARLVITPAAVQVSLHLVYGRMEGHVLK